MAYGTQKISVKGKERVAWALKDRSVLDSLGEKGKEFQIKDYHLIKDM